MLYRKAVQNINPKIPLLWIVAQDDYGSLRARNIPMFKNLPENPYNRADPRVRWPYRITTFANWVNDKAWKVVIELSP